MPRPAKLPPSMRGKRQSGSAYDKIKRANKAPLVHEPEISVPAHVAPSRRAQLLLELQARRAGRTSLVTFAKRTLPAFEDPAHIRILAEHLERVARREIRRLMVFMPPRHGKTELVSIQFPAWYLGSHPQEQIIGASYAEPLAYNNSRACRDTIKSPQYQTLWQHKLDAEGVINWRIAGKENKRPNYVAAGVGGALTGEGADILIIDDPVKNYEEACSVLYRERNWDWYKTVVRTRLQPNAAIILIMTRWHHDDLAGRLLRLAETDSSSDRWDLLVLPADDAEGTYMRPEGVLPPYNSLWPARYPPSELAALAASLGSRQYNALYRQRPSNEEGTIIHRDWFRFYSEDPKKKQEELTELIQSWDMAFKDTTDSSFVVGQVWGRKGADKFLLDQIRKRMDFSETCRQLIALSAKWPRAARKLVEDKANGPAVINHLKSVVSGLIAMPKDISKEAALQAASPDFESGNVYVPDKDANPWVKDFIEELATFGVSAFTDQCDAASQAVNYFRAKHSPVLEYLKSEYKKKLIAMGHTEEEAAALIAAGAWRNGVRNGLNGVASQHTRTQNTPSIPLHEMQVLTRVVQ